MYFDVSISKKFQKSQPAFNWEIKWGFYKVHLFSIIVRDRSTAVLAAAESQCESTPGGIAEWAVFSIGNCPGRMTSNILCYNIFHFTCSFKKQGQQNQEAVAGWGDAIWPGTKLAYGVSPMPLNKNSLLLKHYHSQFADTISLAFLRSLREVSTWRQQHRVGQDWSPQTPPSSAPGTLMFFSASSKCVWWPCRKITHCIMLLSIALFFFFFWVGGT